MNCDTLNLIQILFNFSFYKVIAGFKLTYLLPKIYKVAHWKRADRIFSVGIHFSANSKNTSTLSGFIIFWRKKYSKNFNLRSRDLVCGYSVYFGIHFFYKLSKKANWHRISLKLTKHIVFNRTLHNIHILY